MAASDYNKHSKPRRVASARVARASRWNNVDLEAARSEWARLKLLEYVEEIRLTGIPLTLEGREEVFRSVIELPVQWPSQE